MALDPRFMKAFGQAMGDTIAANIADAITKGSGRLINLSAWASQLRSDASNAINSAAQATVTATTAQTSAATAVTTVRTVQQSIVTLASRNNAPSNVPAWESPSPFLDVSFPWFMLLASSVHHHADSYYVTGGNGSNANLHGSVGSVVSDSNYVTATAGTLVLAAVRLRSDRIINEVTFICGTPPPHVYVGLFQVSADTGAAALIYDFGDQFAAIPGGGIVELMTSMDLSGTAGDLFYVGILPIGGDLPLGAVLETLPTFDVSSTMLPKHITSQVGSLSSTPATIAASPANWPGEVWVGVGQTTGSSYDADARYSYDDDFERGNGALGSSWIQYGSACTISSGVVLFYGSTDGRSAYQYLNPLNTDNQKISVVVGGTRSSQYLAIFMKVQTNFLSAAVCYFNNGTLTIGYATGYNFNQYVVGASDNTSNPPKPGDQVDFWNVGTTYYANWPGAAQPLTWTDAAGHIQSGASCRKAGFSLSRQTFTNSAGIASFHVEDTP